jgi:hypothetical protein
MFRFHDVSNDLAEPLAGHGKDKKTCQVFHLTSPKVHMPWVQCKLNKIKGFSGGQRQFLDGYTPL